MSKNIENDLVNHPEHYCFGGIETIDYIKAKLSPEEYQGYLKGSVIKYLSRAGHKGNALEDFEKAEWYLKKWIETEKDRKPKAEEARCEQTK